MGVNLSKPVNFSEPVPTFRDTQGYICMVLRVPDKFRVLHGTNKVLEMCQRVVSELYQASPISPQDWHVTRSNKHGAMQWCLPRSPFVSNTGKQSATIGKVFVIKIFEEMNHLGYDLITSSDLSRQYDKSSWFFRKCAGERDCQPVICVAPSSTDKIIVVRGVDYVNAAIQTAIVEAWPPGIQRELSSFCDGEKLYEFKLQGKPWYSVGKESVLCRRLLMHIIGKMAAVNWRLLSGTNLKGGSESLFFIYDNSLAGMDCGTTNIAMVSLNRHDRLMLTNFDTNIHNVVRRSILRFFQTNDPEVQDYHGAHEFKLKGTPFHCSGEGATSTRQLICEILSALLNEGWALKSTLNVSRKPFEKSVFIFERCESVNVKFACLALSDVNHIRLLNFPVEVMTNLAKIITNGYMPGVKRESMLTLILKEAEKHGWYLAASADVSTQYNNDEDSLSDYPLDVDSWFFCDQRTRAPLMIAPSEQSPPSYSEHHPPSYSDAMASNLENLGAVGGEERD